MKRISIITVIISLLIPTLGIAKEKQNSYNMQRAIECTQDNEFDKAMEYAQRELSNNPKNALAYDLLGYLYARNNENGKAISSFGDALRYYPKKNRHGRARVHYWRSRVYMQMNDTVPAIADLETAVSLQPEDEDYLSELADLYFFTDRFIDAENIYTKMAALDEGDPYPLYGLARNAIEQEQYDIAQKYIDRSRHLDPTSTTPDILEMRMADKRKLYKKVVDCAIVVLDKDFSDDEAYYRLLNASDSIYDSTVTILKKKAFEDKENRLLWNTILGSVHKYHKNYYSAIETLEETLPESDNKQHILIDLIECYEEIEDLEKVEALANTYLELYPEDAYALIKRADAKFFTQRLDEAKQDYVIAMETAPDYGYFCHYRLGWIADMQGDYDQALKDYDMSITLNDKYPYVLMMKGNLLIDYLGRPEDGRKIMQQVIEMDSIAEDGCCLQYAYVALGERDKAVEVMDSIIALNPNNIGNYYDAACVYSRLHEKENAIKYLHIALEKGYRKFRHIDQDDDMDFIRDTPEFQSLMEEFNKPIERDESIDAEVETVVYEIPIVRQSGGTYLVKASINDLSMDFVLDTGCSDVSLSQVESDFMMKNGYMKQSDLRGSQRYTDANGNTHTSKTVNLSKIKIGELEVNNIRAGIVPNQKAPLLLGQQVLNRFGKVEIDYAKNLLRITVVK